ncbi:hypothetical protein H5410_031417 [Solanum commersonii]|uniref:Uncharacterized protein n=1 Tax=Solanum commersonii TaxID=4109 RepID=A0A9J5YJV2_SOLCO|nr:hypothetical protein H5410_031417 [Solanum commersonii]
MIFWNIRSINTQKSFERLLDLNKRHHYSFIALMEPFQNSSELEHLKRKLGFDKAGVNQNGNRGALSKVEDDLKKFLRLEE